MSTKYIGVDIGSGSVRAGLFTNDGKLEKVAVKEILINNPDPGYYEQCSEDIWNAVCQTVKEVQKNEEAKQIGAISFCATCSLVALDKNFTPVSISKNGDLKWNVVMWMDHRAEKQADFINQTGHDVLKYVGGRISLEMETPKLLWLKQNLPKSYATTTQYFDLADYVRWRATGCKKRSICCLVCKWTFVNTANPHKCCWDTTYFDTIGLSDALPKIGDQFSSPGDSDNISKTAASELGLGTNTVVGFSMIDAHSGVLGMIGCQGSAGTHIEPSSRLCIICGTSNCHMALNKSSLNINGVWGPYFGVILEKYYLSEGGQSAAGKLIDHIVTSHSAYPDLLMECKTHGSVLSKLEKILTSIKSNQHETAVARLTKDLHIWPDFHGNRSPLADPTLKGMISGLSLATSKEDLAILYLATIQSLAYGSRHILEAMQQSGHSFKELVICGGLTKSKLFVQTHADSIGLPVIIPDCTEPVLLGAAISAAAAHKNSDNLANTLTKMAGKCTQVNPQIQDKAYHDKKYKVFIRMLEDQLTYREIMKS